MKQQNSSESFSWPIALSIFFLTILIFFWDILIGKLFFWDDISQYVYPMASFGASMAKQGITPFWNPYMFNGMPYLADFQAQYFYPAHWILPWFLDSSTGLLQPKIIEYIIILHFFIAQLSMAFLLKSKGAGQWGSILGGIAYAFCGSMAVKTNHPMIVYHLALFPFIVYHFEKGLDSRKWLNVLYAGLILGIAVLAGHAQTSAYILIFLAVLGLVTLIQRMMKKEYSGIGIALHLVAMALPVIIAGSLAAIQYLPGQELASYSERNDITYEKTTDGSMMPGQLFTAILPHLYGSIKGNPSPKDAESQFSMLDSEGNQVQTHWYWDTTFYFGIGALMLGLLSFVALPRTPLILTCQYLWIFAFLYGIGNNGFLHSMLSGIPIFGQFRNPGRMMFFASFGFTFLAGLTFSKLNSVFQSSDSRIKAIAILCFPILIALLGAIGIVPSIVGVSSSLDAFVRSHSSTMILIGVIIGIVLYLSAKQILNSLISGIILSLLFFSDAWITFKGFHGSKENPKEMFIVPSDLQNQLKVKPPKDLFRVSMRNQYGMAFQRNGGMAAGIMLYEGYNPILLSRRNPPIESTEDMFDVLNIKYAISIDSNSGSLYFKQREHPLGYARMVYTSKVISDENMLRNSLRKAGNSLKSIVYLEENPGVSLSGSNPDSVKHSISVTKYTPNAQSFSVQTEEPGILCISDIWYPAWKATLDGKAITLLRSNWSLRSIAIPKGNHVIEVYYESDSYAKGKMISLSGLSLTTIAIALLLFFNFKKNNINS